MKNSETLAELQRVAHILQPTILRESDDGLILGEILRRLGYRFNIDHEAYVNRAERKLISAQALDEQPLRQVLEQIAAPATGEWQLFFFGEVEESVRRLVVESLCRS